MDPMGKVPWIVSPKFPDAHLPNDQAEVKSSEATSFGSFCWLEKSFKNTQHTHTHTHTHGRLVEHMLLLTSGGFNEFVYVYSL